MKPTSRLRYVERTQVMYSQSDGSTIGKKIILLQQWWEDKPGDYEDGVTAFGEWRNVPLEAEE